MFKFYERVCIIIIRLLCLKNVSKLQLKTKSSSN